LNIFKSPKLLILGAITFVFLVVGYFSVTTTINQGHVGVVYSRGHGVEDETLGQGLHLVYPWKRVTEYPVSTETVEHGGLSLATKDGKPLKVDITYDYYNNVDKLPYIYNKFKGQKPEAIEDSWLKARLRDSALEVTSKYTILEVFQNREQIKTEIQKDFQNNVKEHGFVIETVVFGTPKPDKNTQKAIQTVVDAQQELEKLKIDKKKATEVAEKKQIEAKGEADAKIIKATGEAKANKVVSDSLTPILLEKMDKEARMKHGWVEIQGAGGVIVDPNKK
jgi:prohibitin 1